MPESVTLTASTEEILCFVNSLVNKTAKIAVFGAGNIGSMIQNKFRINGIEISYFVDNSPQKQGTNFNGVPVISVKELKELCAKENIGIFITSIYAEEIFEQLEKEGLARFVAAAETLGASCFSAEYFWYVLECVKRNCSVDCDSAEFQVFPSGEFGKQFDAFNGGGGGKTADCLPEEAERRTAAFIHPLVDKGVKIALFGAGRIGKMKLEEFRSFGIESSYFIDNFSEKKETLYCGLPVISVTMLKEIAEKEKIRIVIAAASADEIYRQLEEEGLHSLVISDELQQKTITSFSQLRKLFESKVNFGTVLVVEPNNGHGVVVPGYVKYLLDLGYEVDVVITPHNAKLNIFDNTSLPERINNIFVMEIAQIKDLLNQGFRYNDYSAVFLTSDIFYNCGKPALSRKNHFLRICPQIKQNKLLSVSHHQEAQNGLFRKPLVLADFLDGVMVNPHYFGHISPEPKNEITRFISVGEVIDTKNNFPSLIRAVKYLHNDPRYRNRFVITVAGYIIQQQYVPQHLQHYFRWLGYVSTDEINSEMKKADYFLPLLDPDVFAHSRYITIGTSGGFLLIYGFRKLAVLNRKFADKHRLTNENSLLYENSDELADTMKTAIDMSDDEFIRRRNNLAKTADEIYEESLENLGEVMNRIAPLPKREPEELICPCPFTGLEFFGNGAVSFCGGRWLKGVDSLYYGNVLKDSIQDVWNSEGTKELRRSILNGSYSLCYREYCPPPSMKREELEGICEKDGTMHRLPKWVKFCTDSSCGQHCITCRDKPSRISKTQTQKLDSLIEPVFMPLLKEAEVMSLNGAGDLFVSSHCRNLIKAAAEKYPSLKFELHTNGTLCSEENIRELGIYERIERVTVSIHAATKEMYDKIVLGGNFDSVMRNVRHLSEMKKKGLINYILLVFVVHSLNFREMKLFLEKAIELGAVAFFPHYDRWSEQTIMGKRYYDFTVWKPSHTEYNEFAELLQDPIFSSPHCILDGMFRQIREKHTPVSKSQVQKQSRKVILHIGSPKTGTTTIQNFLTQNTAELIQRGLFIPSIGCRGISKFAAVHHFAETFLKCLTNWQTGNNSSAYMERIWNDRKSLELQLSGSKGQTAVLSCEMFFWFNKQEIDKLRTWIHSYFNEVEVIVYLRRQPELWCSIYGEAAKEGNRTPALNWNCNYERICSLWSQVFGKENVKVRVFDRKEMVKNDLTDDFCNAAGIDNTGLVRPKNQNESVDAETAEFMRQLNTYIPLATENGTLNNTLRHKLWDIAEKELGRAGNKGYLLTRRQAQEILDRHRESNNAVACEYLGREQLFDEDVSMYPEETAPHNLTVEKSVEIAAELLKGLHEIQQREIQSRDRKVSEETKTIIHSSSGDEQIFHLAEDWKHHNEAEYLKNNNPPHILNNSKIKLFYYDTYIANACNLKCSQCCHFSPFRTDMPSKEFLIRSYEEWSKRFEPEVITVGGGETLLRSDLLEVILALRYYFPNPLIQILTNGLLLPKLSDAAIKQIRNAGRIVFRVSNHLNTLEFNNLLEKEKKRFESLETPLYVQHSYSWWSKVYCSDSQGILPVPAGNSHFITEKCYGKVAFYGEKVFYCSLVANAYNAVQEGILNKEWDFLRKYKPMTLANTQQQIFDYLTQNVIPECSMCPEDQFETRVPPRQLRGA